MYAREKKGRVREGGRENKFGGKEWQKRKEARI